MARRWVQYITEHDMYPMCVVFLYKLDAISNVSYVFLFPRHLIGRQKPGSAHFDAMRVKLMSVGSKTPSKAESYPLPACYCRCGPW